MIENLSIGCRFGNLILAFVLQGLAAYLFVVLKRSLVLQNLDHGFSFVCKQLVFDVKLFIDHLLWLSGVEICAEVFALDHILRRNAHLVRSAACIVTTTCASRFQAAGQLLQRAVKLGNEIDS